MDLLEERMGEVQGELQCEMGSVCSELQHLGPLEKNVGVLLEKNEILDRVERALQRMEGYGGMSGDKGKEVTRETVTQQPISNILEASGTSGFGKGLEAISVPRNSAEHRTKESHGEAEPLWDRPTETTPVMRRDEDSPRFETWGRRLEMPVSGDASGDFVSTR